MISKDIICEMCNCYIKVKNISIIWRRYYCRWRAAKFRPMLSALGLWAGRNLYRATPSVTRDLGLSDLIQRTAPCSRLLRHAKGCWGSTLTRILTGRYRSFTSESYSVFIGISPWHIHSKNYNPSSYVNTFYLMTELDCPRGADVRAAASSNPIGPVL
jgi:hypothetical protein